MGCNRCGVEKLRSEVGCVRPVGVAWAACWGKPYGGCLGV